MELPSLTRVLADMLRLRATSWPMERGCQENSSLEPLQMDTPSSLCEFLAHCDEALPIDVLLAAASHGHGAAMHALVEYQRTWWHGKTGNWRSVIMHAMRCPVSPALADAMLAVISVMPELSNSDMNDVLVWAHRLPVREGLPAHDLVNFIIAHGAELVNFAPSAARSQNVANLLPLLDFGGVDVLTARTPNAKGKTVPLLEAACSFRGHR